MISSKVDNVSVDVPDKLTIHTCNRKIERLNIVFIEVF